MLDHFSVPLDVILNNGRNYVQGTQLLARAGEVLVAREVLHGPSVLHAAGFHSITDHQVLLQVGSIAAAEQVLGSATFRTVAEESVEVFFVRMPDKAPSGVKLPECSYQMVDCRGPLDATFALDGVNDSEQFLIALIQAAKGRHETLTDTVKDVWFTGLRGADIPLAMPFPANSGHLSISFRRLMRSEVRWQTLMAFSMIDTGGNRVICGSLTFAFRSETKPDVD